MLKKISWAVVTVFAGAILLFGGCKKPGVEIERADSRPEPPPPITEPVVPAPGGGGGDVPAPAQPPAVRAVMDEDVNSRWKAVEITITEKKDGGEILKVEIPLDGETAVDGTPLKIKVLGFVPDFSMGADTITTKSLEDVNPAAKILVLEGEEELFTGWSFRDFPGMHSFDDPRYTIQLSRAIPAE